MTLDLDELERKVKLANEEFEKWTDNAPDWNNGRVHPRVVLALIERVRELERTTSPDPQSDAMRRRPDQEPR